MTQMYDRSILLIGEEDFAKLNNKCVLVVGLGGVGGTAFECLARSGIKNFIIIDFDVVSESNLNRQILYTYSDVNQNKVDCAKKRIQSINKDINVIAINERFSESTITKLNDYKIDFIIDAIDSIDAKISLVKFALDKNIRIISSLGMANRLDPSKVTIMRLDKTYNCPLAKKFRFELRKNGVNLKNVMCAFSSEEPVRKGIVPASMMMVPSSAGLNIAYYVLNCFKGE